jgi:hypothetical protein
MGAKLAKFLPDYTAMDEFRELTQLTIYHFVAKIPIQVPGIHSVWKKSKGKSFYLCKPQKFTLFFLLIIETTK